MASLLSLPSLVLLVAVLVVELAAPVAGAAEVSEELGTTQKNTTLPIEVVAAVPRDALEEYSIQSK
jgi:hypothetical protein